MSGKRVRYPTPQSILDRYPAETAPETALTEDAGLSGIVPYLVPMPNGGFLNSGGTFGNKGGGRTPEAFKVWMRSLASSEQVQRGLETILADPSSPMFVAALKHVTEHGYGKPKETREVTGADGGPVRVVFSTE